MKRGEEIPDDIRQQVYERDLRRCRMCGKTNAYTYSVHHILYRSEGGTNDLKNLILLCGSGSDGCHLKVHSRKDVYQPILLELVDLSGVTGLALMRRMIRAAASDRSDSRGLQRSIGNGQVSRFFGDGGRSIHDDGRGKSQP